jgi:hypothetical protein
MQNVFPFFKMGLFQFHSREDYGKNATAVVALAYKCETTKYTKHNKGKRDSGNETRQNLRNETKFYL